MAFSIVLYGHHILVRMLVEKRVNNENQTPKPHSEVLSNLSYYSRITPNYFQAGILLLCVAATAIK